MEPKRSLVAWQPFTPQGVAAFAGARLGRLLAVQTVVAISCALVTIWVIAHTWFPAIGAAIENLPQKAEIRNGSLEWTAHSPQRLADNSFLAVVIDLEHTGQARSPAHLLVEFGAHDVWVFSLLGYVPAAYPQGWRIAFSRNELQPSWGAWAVPILGLTAGGLIVALIITWAILAAIYAAPVRLIAFFLNRELDWGGSWRIAAAGLMPGAVFLSVAIVVYGLGAYDLVRLIAATGLHLVIGWAYCIAGAISAPRTPQAAAERANPFATPPAK